jgi:Spy/CpxP family protein refolding chaperone
MIQTVVMGIALLGITGAAGAQAGPGFGDHRPPMERMMGARGPHGRWWNDQAVIDRLKLTDDQRKDMDNILLEHREKLIDLRGDVEKSELALEPLVNADQPDESAILAQIDKVAQARAELEKANARFLLALRAKLSPDQWKQLRAMHGEHRDGMHRHEWRDRGPGSNPGSGGPDTAPPPAGPGPQGMLQEQPAPGQQPTPDVQ